MKAVNRVWSAVGIYVQALSFLLALFCVFTFSTPKASAAVLSDEQVASVASLAASYGASEAMLSSITQTLSDEPTTSAEETSGVPTCVLTASRASVAAGESVTLTWKSEHALYAGSASGARMLPNGSITVNPTESTTYFKKVYNNTGIGSCEVVVEVIGTTAAPVRQVAQTTLGNYLSTLFSQMQLGAVVVGETLSGLFSPPQLAAATDATLGCSLTTSSGTANINSRITLSWTSTGVPQVLAIYLGDKLLVTNLPASGSYAVPTSGFPAKYNYRMEVIDSTNATAKCYASVSVVNPAFTSPLAKIWPQLYGQMGSYPNELTAANMNDLFAAGYKLNMSTFSLGNESVMDANGAARVDDYIKYLIYDGCSKAASDCAMTKAQELTVLNNVKAYLDQVKNDQHIVAFVVLDDYPGNIKTFLGKVHDLVVESNKTSAVARPVICPFEGYHDINSNTAPFSNYNSAACDAVGIYEYGMAGGCFLGICIGTTNAATELTKVYPKIESVLLAGGWNKSTQPLIGIPQAFVWGQFGNLDRTTIKKETQEFCQYGASSILFFAWNAGDTDPSWQNPAHTSWMRDGLADGLAACRDIWTATGSAEPPPSDTPSLTDQVTLYKDCNYAGASVSLKEGSYDSTDLTNKGFNNIASAIRIPAGFSVAMYDGGSLSGTSYPLSSDTSCFTNINFNDKMSSIKVTKASSGSSQVTYIAPANNATDLAVPVTLSWNAVTNATSYVFYLAPTADSLVSYQNSKATSFSFTGAEKGKTYYWRVDAVSSIGTTKGAVWKFSTKAGTITPPPSKPGPIDGRVVVPAKINAAPTCTLTASATSVKKNASVVLTWTSQNATSASTATGGTNAIVNGSVTVTVTEDTKYVKTVYNSIGQGTCSVSIDVTSDSDGRGSNKTVVNPFRTLSQFFSDMQAGAAVVAEAYMSLTAQ
jgi:hypothetical protein